MCKAYGPEWDLASPNTQRHQNTLSNWLIGENEELFWIGLHDLKEEGTWEWSDGKPRSFNGFFRGEPNNWGEYGEDCVALGWGGPFWNDSHCSSELYSICERNARYMNNENFW